MCGIYGLLSAREPANGPGDELFRHLDTLLEASSAQDLGLALSGESSRERALQALEASSSAAGRWVSRGAFLALAADPSLRSRLAAAAERLRSWVGRLELCCDRGQASDPTLRETLHRLIVGGKDIAWQIERDVLESIEPIQALSSSREPLALRRAWELNLILRSLDRLEVRGRDSAGLAVYVRFPGAAALEGFLDAAAGGAPDGTPGGVPEGVPNGTAWRQEIARRSGHRLGHGAIVRPASARDTLLFVFKVASEVGRMGDNAAFLRRALAEDALFQALLREPGVDIQCLAHTRWASNGVISLPNCHPVDSTVLRRGVPVPETEGALVAVLNGDIDNYQDLVERYVRAFGLELDPAITTDAKIVPVVIAHHLRRTGSLEAAVAIACQEFEGSFAIALMAAQRPGVLYCAQKGSGQGLFFGQADESLAVASEMYGVVELTPHYLKAEGERVEGGEVFRVRVAERGVALERITADTAEPPDAARWKRAQITTRDINRGRHAHFFIKEITESVESVRKTLRGKFEVAETGEVRFLLGSEALPVELLAGLRDGRIRQIAVIGQGTAAVAAQGVAHLLEAALCRPGRTPGGSALAVRADKATEFSAHRIRPDMSDTLVVAVSQSGTTTDTNRTVALARERGAFVLGIVNRRNSDLVYKSHAVLYTSDGRDIEMSVASTKAFYAQNVAGQVLALALANALGTLVDAEVQAAVEELRRLPETLQKTLALEPQIADLARRFALGRRHWAVVGSGPMKIAADEVRIKLSELCYKSIAVDYLEDKKHIDLSSEPLVIVCAAGLKRELVSDSVKEVSIFKAHNGIPLVITDEGVSDFDVYAAGTVKLPTSCSTLAHLPVTMAGHLFGYHAAVAMDHLADRFRWLRARIVSLQEEKGCDEAAAVEVLDAVSTCAASPLAEIEDRLERGELNGGLDVGCAVRVSRLLDFLLGRITVDAYTRQKSPRAGVIDTVLATLNEAVEELSRPVDAIKHQAKTVTVGISRGEAPRTAGALLRVLREAGVAESDLAESHRAFLAAFEPLVAAVVGVTLDRLTGLDPLGRPAEGSQIVVERKLGCAQRILSRSESPQPLTGNKWAAVKHRSLFLGHGQSDGRKILIVPLVSEQPEGMLLLYHLELAEGSDRAQRLKALAARARFFDRLRAAVTERNLDWEPALLDSIDNDTLFLQPPERVAEELAEARVGGASAVYTSRDHP
jgi:glucosamine--fructose-6-phosphate aminotransferase (isomerizing)